MEATSLIAESLTTYLISTLSEHRLDPACIVYQGYDGASVMSGMCSGVQQRLKEVSPCAVYIHCYAHKLNLALVDCVKSNKFACDFFCLLEALMYSFRLPKCLWQSKRSCSQRSRHIGSKNCHTRWACRQGAVNAICCTYDSVLSTLDEVS